MSAYRDRTDLYQVLARVWLKNRCVSTVSVVTSLASDLDRITDLDLVGGVAGLL